jgi:hypothetical protein
MTTVTPKKLVENSILNTVYFTMYTVPVGATVIVTSMDFPTTASCKLFVHIVPSGQTATNQNTLFWNRTMPVGATTSWRGRIVMTAGDTIQVKITVASAAAMQVYGVQIT